MKNLPSTFSIATPNERIHKLVQERFFEQDIAFYSGRKTITEYGCCVYINFDGRRIFCSDFRHHSEISLTDFLSKDIHSNFQIGKVEISREDAAKIVEKSKQFNKYCLPDKFYVKTADRELSSAVRGQIARLLPVTVVQGIANEAVRYCAGEMQSVSLESVTKWPRVRLDTLFEPKTRDYDTMLLGEYRVKFNKETATIGGGTISIAELNAKLST